MKMKADSDDKYKVVYATGDTASDGVIVAEVDTAKLRKLVEVVHDDNKILTTIYQ